MTEETEKKLRVVVPSEDASGKPTGLKLLRAPFPANQISKRPKPTKHQTDEVRADFKKGIRCDLCGGWHHPNVVHLDYVGHAALTDRLLDCDEQWNWEPMEIRESGVPVFDGNGGMWIKLTVCGVTRMGYGHPDGKQGGDAIKEVIGDALRNAAMRFGAALDLWHKGDLHAIAEDDSKEAKPKTDTPKSEPAKPEPSPAIPRTITPDQFVKMRKMIEDAELDEAVILKHYGAESLEQFPAAMFDKAMHKMQATIDAKTPKKDDLDGDEIPF